MISKYSVKKPLTVAVLVVMIFVLGVVSYTKMTTDLLPSIDMPYVIVNTTYQGATPEKVEASVTKPLEQALATTSFLENISSISSENSSTIMLEFNQSVNMDSVMIELSSKIDMIKPYLDDSVSTPMLMKLNPDMMPIMVTSIDIEGMDIKEITEYVENIVIPEFERIEGVASVTESGTVTEYLRVDLNEEKIGAINEKILSNVNSEFESQEKELSKGENEINTSLNALDEETNNQNEAIDKGIKEINSGINELEKTVSGIGKSKEELEDDIESLNFSKHQVESQLSILNKQLESLDEGAIKDKLQEEINKLQSALSEIESGIKLGKEAIGAIESLEELKSKKTELESSKTLLNTEMNKAKQELDSAKEQLSEGKKQLNDAKETAQKSADITDKITPEMIGNILMAQNFSMPAGYIKEGEEKYSIRIGDKFNSIEEVEDLLLFELGIDGLENIRVKDVASVYIDDNSNETYANINGNEGIMLAFQKASTYSTANVTKDINKTIEKLNSENKDLNITTLMDQGVYIDMIVDSVLQNLIYGGVLAIVVLLVFLKNFKTTLIISFSIPISLLFSIVLMYFNDMTLNIISLSGLALGVGMLVDNSIVVIENIYRLRNSGMDMKSASVHGAKQVSSAIVASTLTTVCVFLPIVFTDGLTKQLFVDMGLTIAFSLFASLIVALTVVPAMASNMLTKVDEKEHKLFDKFVLTYENLLKKCLKHKAIVILLTLGVFIFSIYSLTNMGFEFMPSMDSTQMTASLKMPKDSKREDTLKMSDDFIKRVLTIDDVQTVGAIESSGQGMMSQEPGTMSFYIILNEDKELKNTEVEKLIKEKTSDMNAQISIMSSNMDMSALGGSGINLVIKGNDLEKLKDISKDLATKIESIDGTVEVSDGLEDSVSETKVVVDKEKAMSYGLTTAQVYQEISKGIQDSKSSTALTIDSNDYNILVGNPSKVTKDNLGDYELIGAKDNKEVKIKLKDIATITSDESMQSVNRDNQSRYITVSALVDDSYNIGLVGREVEKMISEYGLPDGYSIEMTGENENINNSISDMLLMGAMAILFIYLIMVSQFQSLLSPFIVMFTIPLAFTGGILALLITNTNISVISMLGFLVLSGVVVNNGIVFVDYINQLRLEGKSKEIAIIETGRTRIRPILMTALTTILAMSTMAVGVGMGAEMTKGLAIVTIGGLIYSTVLTLIVIPVLYDLFNRKDMKKIIIDKKC